MNSHEPESPWVNRETPYAAYTCDPLEPSPKKGLRPWQGLVFFLIVMAAMLFIAAPLQFFLGMAGVALTELLLLLLALAFILITRQDFRKILPLHRPRWKALLATILTWLGSYLLVLLSTLILMYFFPEGFADVSSSMGLVFSSTPPAVTFLIVAMMPPICEEAVHRGVIQHTFQSIRQPALIVLLTGLLFGLFHMDPYRFVPTALLGMGLAYLMQKTDNLLYPALFHFINNALSVAASGGGASMDVSADFYTGPLALLSIGVYLMFAAAAPFCLLGASCLLHRPDEPRRKLLLPVLLISLLAGLMIIAGFCILLFTILQHPDIAAESQEIPNLLVAWLH